MAHEQVTAPGNAWSATEGQDQDFKSLRLVSGKTADWNELARDCVCFANGSGGRIVIGIEDDQDHPPPDQRIDPRLLDKLRKRVGELTVNVQATPQVQTAANGGEVIILAVQRSVGVASTSDGRYFLRVGDMCRPLVGDEVMRLADERPGTPWETMVSARVPRASVDRGRLSAWKKALQASDRVKPSVKEKAADELLEHYGLARDDELTNLGILLFGAPQDRAKLGTAPVVQAIRYDAHGGKVDKLVWDDYALSPVELLDAVWRQVPDFRGKLRAAGRDVP